MQHKPGRQRRLARPRLRLPPPIALLTSTKLDELGKFFLAANQLLGSDIANLGGVALFQQLTRSGRHHIDETESADGYRREQSPELVELLSDQVFIPTVDARSGQPA